MQLKALYLVLSSGTFLYKGAIYSFHRLVCSVATKENQPTSLDNNMSHLWLSIIAFHNGTLHYEFVF
ncbi:hypothetical protein L1887_17268 [Cichorium endivia]|nr:hypothetical protein L1887_17268 [Cichorium endivia]